MEYEIAVELGKPVFVFVATRRLPLDAAPDEPEELRGLQLEHLKRIIASDHIRMAFHSLAHLTDQVRVMRLTGIAGAGRPRPAGRAVGRRADRRGSDPGRRGDGGLVASGPAVSRARPRIAHALGRHAAGGDVEQYEVNFETADAAVNAALALHEAIAGTVGMYRLPGSGSASTSARSSSSRGRRVAGPPGQPRDGECRRVDRLAAAGQTLLTRTAFDIAREHVRQAPSSGAGAGTAELDWQSHGRYLISDTEEMLEVCEVGVAGLAPFDRASGLAAGAAG